MNDFPKAYNPKETEERIYKLWEESGAFEPKGEGKPYTVMIAPPNITGNLHMGHALENTISDILVRYHRMKGFKTLWVPGVDHAGISAQSKVEKELAKQGIKKQDLGREEFLKRMQEWKEQYGHIILDQLKKLGFSMDWSRNNYDKIGHFMQGFGPVIWGREILIRLNVVKNSKWLNFLLITTVLGFAAFYEFIEWWIALLAGASGDAFLGTQGYVWDTQSDMFLAMIGAIVALLLLTRLHDQSMKKLNYAPNNSW